MGGHLDGLDAHPVTMMAKTTAVPAPASNLCIGATTPPNEDYEDDLIWLKSGKPVTLANAWRSGNRKFVGSVTRTRNTKSRYYFTNILPDRLEL
jgi:hypothetical protein